MGQPVVVMRDFNGYQRLADVLQGRIDDPTIAFLLPWGFSAFLALVENLFNNPSIWGITIAISLGCAVIPMAIFLLFVQASPPWVAFLLSFSYLAADATLRMETMAGSDALSSALLATSVLSIAVWLRNYGKHGIALKSSIVVGLTLLLNSAIRPQFLLLFAPITMSYLLARAIVCPRFLTNVRQFVASTWKTVLTVSLPLIIFIALLFGSNFFRHDFVGLSPLGPFNKLNYSSAIFEDFKPQNPMEAQFKSAMVETIRTSGTICTLCRGRDKEIYTRLNLSPGAFYTLLTRSNNEVLAQHRGYYIKSAAVNALRFFAYAIDPDDDSYANGYLVRYVRDHAIWRFPARVLSAVAPPIHPVRQLLGAGLLFITILIIYRRNFSVLFINLLCVSTVAYTFCAISLSQNAEMFRYRSTTQWLWIAYLWWGSYMVLDAILARVRGANAKINPLDTGVISALQ